MRSLASLSIVLLACSSPDVGGKGSNLNGPDASVPADLTVPDLAEPPDLADPDDLTPPPDLNPWYSTVCPDLVVSALEVDFPPGQTFKVRAEGARPITLTVAQIGGPGAPAFDLRVPRPPIVVPAGGEVAFPITYKPADRTGHSAWLLLTTEGGCDLAIPLVGM